MLVPLSDAPIRAWLPDEASLGPRHRIGEHGWDKDIAEMINLWSACKEEQCQKGSR